MFWPKQRNSQKLAKIGAVAIESSGRGIREQSSGSIPGQTTATLEYGSIVEWRHNTVYNLRKEELDDKKQYIQ